MPEAWPITSRGGLVGRGYNGSDGLAEQPLMRLHSSEQTEILSSVSSRSGGLQSWCLTLWPCRWSASPRCGRWWGSWLRFWYPKDPTGGRWAYCRNNWLQINDDYLLSCFTLTTKRRQADRVSIVHTRCLTLFIASLQTHGGCCSCDGGLHPASVPPPPPPSHPTPTHWCSCISSQHVFLVVTLSVIALQVETCCIDQVHHFIQVYNVY